jgi:hypothetical protein
VFIPVGANFPALDHAIENGGATAPGSTPTVAIFGVSGAAGRGGNRGYFICGKSRKVQSCGLSLMIIGRGSAEAESALRKRLDGSEVELQVLGLLPAGGNS